MLECYKVLCYELNRVELVNLMNLINPENIKHKKYIDFFMNAFSYSRSRLSIKRLESWWGQKGSCTYLGKSPDTNIGNLFDTFLKLLYLINYPFIHPCFASFSLLVEVINIAGTQGNMLALLLNVMLETLGYWPIIPKNLPGHWVTLS